ncbi:MDR family MFS transporter [Streptomyces sp. NBC_01408]|uniref:MDR family MFS transporter n=1 Tax=Streptomyces sp. NBC_01408 TaxID=2903855 RepID=UPI00224D8E4C|nr:MDR family MFS transporter [Streptomyces sp. NBC_01408]MCX4695992.1 MDR family MFS transporter [Streptomyces sp. NBC_01408]
MDQLIAEDPTRIGPYRLIARLGAGGMGLVYLGRSEGGRTVAVKVVQAEFAGNPEFRKRFAREVAAARRVGGNWTAAVLDADTEAAVPWVATQYIPGPDLHTVVAKDFGPLPEHAVRTLANRLALALRAVHEAGLIHRDLKPSNVLVTVDGPRVIDFGIARAMDSLTGDSLHTRTGMLIGSAGFMSPEQVRGLELTSASDVFCLGAVLVYAATGRLLFGAADTGLNAHLFRVAEEEADLTGVPESLVDLVRACLDKDPAGRPTPEEVAARTATDQAGEWLPGTVLAQLGRHAAQLLDFAPATPPAEASVGASAGAVGALPDPRSPSAQQQAQPLPPPPAYAPTAPAHFVPGQGFGPPPLPASFPDPVAPDPAAPHPRRWWGLLVIALTQLLVLLAATTFNLAVPSVQAELDLAADVMTPVVSAYFLAFGALLLLGGHIADLVGARRTMVIGLAGFAAASALGGSADEPGLLIAARALQGAFAALLTPSALSLVATGFTDPRERARAFGIYAAIAAGGTAIGMLTGGWVLELLDWRWSLYAGVPLAVIALTGALTLLPDRPGRTGARFDGLGVLLGSLGLAALTYGLGNAESLGWSEPLTAVLVAGGVLLLAAFLWWQTRASSPLLAPYVLKDRNRLGAVLTLVLAGACTLALFPALDFWMRQIVGYGPTESGLAYLPMIAAAVLGSTQLSARLQSRVAPRTLIVAGLVATAVGTALLAGVDTASTFTAGVMPGMLLSGFGLGLAFMPLLATATAAVAPQHAGGASAAVTTAQAVGQSIGAAVLGGVFAARLSGGSPLPETFAVEFLGVYTTTLWIAVGGTLLAVLSAALLVTAGRTGAETPAPTAQRR